MQYCTFFLSLLLTPTVNFTLPTPSHTYSIINILSNELANRIGTSPSNLLSSVKGNPTISKLQDIAAALQVSVSELLTQRPEKALGLAIIDGVPYQVSRPSATVVQLPVYNRYDDLRSDIKSFVIKSIEVGHNATLMGMLESFEVFSLLYDAHDPGFFLSLCYADGKVMTLSYHRLEFSNWQGDGKDETIEWDMDDLIEEITNDIEGAVPMKLQSSSL